jgi:hypothetical protein
MAYVATRVITRIRRSRRLVFASRCTPARKPQFHLGSRTHCLPAQDPRSVIDAAMLFANCTDERRVTKPPSAVFKTLALLGRAPGLKLDA